MDSRPEAVCCWAAQHHPLAAEFHPLAAAVLHLLAAGLREV